MKKLFIASILLVFATTNTPAQKIADASVPVPVKQSFSKQYPGIKASWEKENGKYEAGFKKEGNDISVLYDADGSSLETETAIQVATLPKNVLTYLNVHYKGKPIHEAAKIVKTGGAINYEAEVEGKDLLFDVDGKFIKSIKD